MKILIVEDDKNKREQVAKHIAAISADQSLAATVVSRYSYQSGLRECVDSRPDLLILDMTMPTFDQDLQEPGGRPRHFAGRDILRELQRRKLVIPAIVFTGFDVIGEGKEQRTRAALTEELAAKFPDMFIGTVFYTASESGWKSELTVLVLRAVGRTNGLDISGGG